MKKGLTRLALSAAIFSGVSSFSSCDVAEEIFGDDVVDLALDLYIPERNISLPPLSDDHYAQKLYISKGAIDGEGNLLFERDFDFARFNCSRSEPLEFVVGFGRTFRNVGVRISCDESLEVEGGAATTIYLGDVLDLGRTYRFAFVNGRTSSAVSEPLGENEFGGETNFRTNDGNERYFKFTARPLHDGEVSVGIDYLYAN